MSLQTVVEHFESVIHQLPNHWCITDEKSHIVLANKAQSQTMGFNDNHQVAGLSYNDMRCDAVCLAESFCNQDQLVLQTQQSLDFLAYSKFNNGWKLLLGSKKPLLNTLNHSIGIIHSFRDSLHDNLIDLGRFLIDKNQYVFGMQQKHFTFQLYDEINTKSIQLSKRQHECLFLILRGKKPKEISQILNISSKTVETYISQLKTKFDSHTTSQLFETAIALGYFNIIPRSIMNSNDDIIPHLLGKD